MTDRRLVLAAAARRDVARRGRVLLRERGEEFATGWTETLVTWIRALTADGVILGTAHPFSATARSFPYKKQATILAEFTDTDLRIIRVYFAGQDWLG